MSFQADLDVLRADWPSWAIFKGLTGMWRASRAYPITWDDIVKRQLARTIIAESSEELGTLLRGQERLARGQAFPPARRGASSPRLRAAHAWGTGAAAGRPAAAPRAEAPR